MTIDPQLMKRLHTTISAACPIVGLSLGTVGDSSTVTFQPDAAATPAQIAAGQSAIASFDWSQAAQTNWQNQQDRTAAKTALNSSDAGDKLMRSVAGVLLDEINALRAAVVLLLPARTLAQLKTAIASKIDSGSVDT